MAHRKLLGFIPMRWLSGLAGKSPKGRFTNGYTWTDAISAKIAEQFVIDEEEIKYHLTPEDIADEIIEGKPHLKALAEHSYLLADDLYVKYKGLDFVRNYDEGGLTAFDYHWWPSNSIKRFFSRLILATLTGKREKLLSYDAQHQLSKEHKAQTLVVEWSGANDLITVNREPSEIEAERAVQARIQNIKALMKNGYRHFVLFNLPDLSLTPRYQAKSKSEKENAQKCSEYFNKLLAEKCKELEELYPHCSFDVFDVNGLFSEAYNSPGKYGFEEDKLRTPFTKSKDFKIDEKKHLSPSTGYMFWDDVHPTADLHAFLAEKFYEKYSIEYHFSAPQVEAIQSEELDISEKDLLTAFEKHYKRHWDMDRHGFFGSLRKSKINLKDLTLDKIFQHALYGGGQRSREVLEDLQWINKAGDVDLNIPVLKEAMGRVLAEHGGLKKELN